MELSAIVFCIPNGDPNEGCDDDSENVLDVDVTAFDEVTAGWAGAPNWNEAVGVAVGFDPKLNVDVGGVPKLKPDLTVESVFFSPAEDPLFGVLQQAQTVSV